MSKPKGLDWATINSAYVEAGGELQPEVWKAPAPVRYRDRTGIGGRPRREADRQDVVIRARYDEGASLPEIVREFGIPKTSARNAILRAGGTMRSRKDATRLAASSALTVAQEDQILQRYTGGEGSQELAEAFGVGPRLIRRVVVAKGGTIRSKSEALKLSIANRNKQLGDKEDA